MCNDWGWGGVLDSMFLKAAQEQLWREWEVEAKGGGVGIENGGGKMAM